MFKITVPLLLGDTGLKDCFPSITVTRVGALLRVTGQQVYRSSKWM